MKLSQKFNLTERDIDRIVEMAWEDRTPFDAIESQFGLAEKDVIKLMKSEMKESSWIIWRKRVQGRATKHRKIKKSVRFKSARQKIISHNKVSKR